MLMKLTKGEQDISEKKQLKIISGELRLAPCLRRDRIREGRI